MGALQLLTLLAGLGIAGLAKGATAMGLPLIATPILASVFGPKQAVVIITIPIFVANTLLVLQSWRILGYLRTLLPLMVANAAGTVVGASAILRVAVVDHLPKVPSSQMFPGGGAPKC